MMARDHQRRCDSRVQVAARDGTGGVDEADDGHAKRKADLEFGRVCIRIICGGGNLFSIVIAFVSAVQ